MEANTIAAVVVTYNRLELLKECVAAIKGQTHQLNGIIIINNSSTDGTGEWLQKQAGLMTITQENKGGAAGFYTGIKTAFESGYEWIWCMDDDGCPDVTAMQALMKYSARKPCVMNALVLDKENHEDIVFKTGSYTSRNQIQEAVVEGAANLFNGTLFHYEILKRVGLPLKDLIIWGDESEYFNRIKYQHHLPLFTVAGSLHYHPKQSGSFYKKEWRIENDWKPYFFLRNKVFVYSSRYRSKVLVLANYVVFLAGFACSILVYQKTFKGTKLKMLAIAGFDGIRRDTRKSIADIKGLFCK